MKQQLARTKKPKLKVIKGGVTGPTRGKDLLKALIRPSLSIVKGLAGPSALAPTFYEALYGPLIRTRPPVGRGPHDI